MRCREYVKVFNSHRMEQAMNGTVLLSFFAGVVTVIFLEIQGLEALLQPIRSAVSLVLPGG